MAPAIPIWIGGNNVNKRRQGQFLGPQKGKANASFRDSDVNERHGLIGSECVSTDKLQLKTGAKVEIVKFVPPSVP